MRPASADFLQQLVQQKSPLAIAIRKSGKKLRIAPAMNVMMWNHPATQRNVRTLLDAGAQFIGPANGKMACGDIGYGRFIEPVEIIAALTGDGNHAAYDEVRASLQPSPELPRLAVGHAIRKILLLLQEGAGMTESESLIRQLQSRGYDISCALNEGTLPVASLAALSSHPVYSDHFQEPTLQGMEHIRLPEAADLVLVMPGNAHTVKEMVTGAAHTFSRLHLPRHQEADRTDSLRRCGQPAITGGSCRN